MLKPSYLTVNLGTEYPNSSLYLSNHFIHQSKSFIMRKTVIAAAFAVLVLSVVSAKTEVNNQYDLATLTVKDSKEINSFCKAIVKGDLDAVKKLISLGEDVNQKSLGKTPAIFAARYNRVEILKVLILNGANLSIKCDRGYSVKKYAKLSNAQDALEVIEKALES